MSGPRARSMLSLLALIIIWQNIRQGSADYSSVNVAYTCVDDGKCASKFVQQQLQSNSSLAAGLAGNGTQAQTAALVEFWHLLLQSNCCYKATVKGPVRLISEVTPQHAILQWVSLLPNQGGRRMPPQLLPNISLETIQFTTSQDILNYYQNWPDTYSMAVKDGQMYFYTQGLRFAFQTDAHDMIDYNPQQSSIYRPVGLIYPRVYHLLYYHPEVLNKFNISISSLSTWEALLQAAEKLNGQDFDGDGQVDYAFCLDLKLGCHKAVYLYTAIAATVVQGNGPAQGFQWDPSNMSPLITSQAVVNYTASIMGRMAAMAQPDASESCNAANDLFAGPQLRCAFTLDWDFITYLLGSNTSQVSGADVTHHTFGAVLSPGSTTVLNRATYQLEPCTTSTCQYAQQEAVLGPDGSTPTALVNRAPFSVMSCPESAVSTTADPELIKAANELWTESLGVMPKWVIGRESLLRNQTELWKQQCLSQPGNNVVNCDSPNWQEVPAVSETQINTTLGLDPNYPPNSNFYAFPTLQDLGQTYQALFQARWHPNAAPDLAIPLASFYNHVIEVLGCSIAQKGRDAGSQGIADDVVMTLTAQAVQLWSVVDSTIMNGYWGDANVTNGDGSSYWKVFRELYWQSIGYDPSLMDDKGKGMPEADLIVAIVLPVGLMVLLGLVVAHYIRRLYGYRGLLGGVKAPGVSPHTTLLITDIYNSTVLWEALPAAVMDTALKVHHEVLRTAAAKHKGFESACEGDALIIAFHTPEDAVCFALEAQQALLHAPWPTELLTHHDAQEVWVTLPTTDKSSSPVHLWAKGVSGSGLSNNSYTGPGFADSINERNNSGHSSQWLLARSRSGATAGGNISKPRWSLARLLGMLKVFPSSDSFTFTQALGKLPGTDTGLGMPPSPRVSSQTPRLQAAPGNNSFRRQQSGQQPTGNGHTAVHDNANAWQDRNLEMSNYADGTPKHSNMLSKRPSLMQSLTRKAPNTEKTMGKVPLLVDAEVRSCSPAPETGNPSSPARSHGLSNIHCQDVETGLGNLHENVHNWHADTYHHTAHKGTGKTRRHSGVQSSVTVSSWPRCNMKRKSASLRIDAFAPPNQRSLQIHNPTSGRQVLAAYATGSMSDSSDDMKSSESSQENSPKLVFRAQRISMPVLLPSMRVGSKDKADMLRNEYTNQHTLMDWVKGNAPEAANGTPDIQPGNSNTDGPVDIIGNIALTPSEAVTTRMAAGNKPLVTTLQQSHSTPPAMTWRQKCQAWWPRADNKLEQVPGMPSATSQSGKVCIFRGLRVRMGIHSGLHVSSEISHNRTTQSIAYSGYAMKMAKTVGDAAAGGMVLISNATFMLLASRLPDLPGNPLPVYMGDALVEVHTSTTQAQQQHDNKGTEADMDCIPLYALVTPDMRPRLGHQEPLRGLQILQLGNLDAPVGSVAIVFLYVVGASALITDLGYIATRALDTFQVTATQQCCDHGGYVIEATEGLCLAAFPDAAAAVLWCSACASAMKTHAWSEALLEHEMCQEVLTLDEETGELVCQHRGPRLRAGVHVGSVEVHVNQRTGRMAYRGRVMNRAARIASKATDDQILCSLATLQRWPGVQLATSSISMLNSATAQAVEVSKGPNDVVPNGIVNGNAAISNMARQGSSMAGFFGAEQYESLTVMGQMKYKLHAEKLGAFALKGVSEIIEVYSCKATPQYE